MILRIFLQSDIPLIETRLRSGWNYIRWGLGAHYWPTLNVVRLSNGVYNGDGAGGVFVAKIQLLDAATRGVLYEGGDGTEYLPPRSVLYLEAWDAFRTGKGTGVAMVGSVAIPMPRAQAELHKSVNPPAVTERLGLWNLAGPTQPDAPGADGIDLVPGWERDFEWSWERHKAVMARTALDCLDRDTGQPMPRSRVAVDGYYSLSRGWAKTTQLPRFVRNPQDGSDARWPVDLNTGACEYRSRLLGLTRWDGYLPADGQHLIRATSQAKVLAGQHDWEPARFDLAMIATDASYAWTKPHVPVHVWHAGHTSFGRRECAWVTDTMAHTRSLFADSVELANRVCEVQTVAGQFMRCGSDREDQWGFSPPAWSGEDPMPKEHDVGQIMEGILTCQSLGNHDRWREIRRYCDSLFKGTLLRPSIVEQKKYVPKWAAVGKLGGPAYSRVPMATGAGDYFPYGLLGLLACHALHTGKSPRPFFDMALQIATPTQGKATSVPDLYARLSREWSGRGQVTALLSALERAEGR